MHLEILTAFAICGFVYVLARIAGWAEAQNTRKHDEIREEERLARLDELYGRPTKDSR